MENNPQDCLLVLYNSEELFRISREGDIFIKSQKVATNKKLADIYWQEFAIPVLEQDPERVIPHAVVYGLNN